MLARTNSMARADLGFLADEQYTLASTSPQHHVEMPAYSWGS
jgi:hypothetical protein